MATKGAAGAKKSNIRGQFINTQQTEAYRQLVTTENRILASKNKADLDRMKTHMEDKSNFFTMYQKPEVLTASKTQFHEHDKDTFYKSLPFHRDTVNDYDPKTKKDRTYATHKAVQGPLAKELFSTPVTTSQAYGWREPIDTLNLGLGLKNSFPEASSVQFRENKKNVEKK